VCLENLRTFNAVDAIKRQVELADKMLMMVYRHQRRTITSYQNAAGDPEKISTTTSPSLRSFENSASRENAFVVRDEPTFQSACPSADYTAASHLPVPINTSSENSAHVAGRFLDFISGARFSVRPLSREIPICDSGEIKHGKNGDDSISRVC